MRNAIGALGIAAMGLTIPGSARAAQLVTPVAQTVTVTAAKGNEIAAKFSGNLIQGSLYQLTFAAQGRAPGNSGGKGKGNGAGSGAGVGSGVDVSVHGSNIFTVAPAVVAFQDYTTTFKYYGDNTLLFSGVGPNATIDNVRVSLVSVPSVPESATWAMMMLGLGLTGVAMRRRAGSKAPLSIALA